MLNDFTPFVLSTDLQENYRTDETELLKKLVSSLTPNFIQNPELLKNIESLASDLISKVRQKRLSQGGLDAFLAEYDLSSFEGITLMCLAEALLRIPDNASIDKLIKDKISQGDWAGHLQKSQSLFVNAATWSLMLTGKILDPAQWPESKLKRALNSFFNKSSKSTIRKATRQAMRILGQQFVMGETISAAIDRAKENEANGYRYSYDMLGEAAYTQKDAQHYYATYELAIHAIGKAAKNSGVIKSPGISIKLSALHPRYELSKKDRVLQELLPQTKKLCLLAKKYDISLTIDAEETERLELSLEILKQLAEDPELAHWNGLGLAVQAYQRRAFYVIDFLIQLAQKTQKRLMVRLVKGAYWDSEIKRSQINGQATYPVFTRKLYTDVSYLACAQKILAHTQEIYPMFATHNAYTLSAIINLAGSYKDFEFQCLHGMGSSLYDHIVGSNNLDIPCRIYAPVGTHKHLLAYLVRRLLENGANTSFVNRILDERQPIETLIENPVKKASALQFIPHPNIPQPLFLYGATRMNAIGLDLSDQLTLSRLQESLTRFAQEEFHAKPLIAGISRYEGELEDVLNPTTGKIIGTIQNATTQEVDKAILISNQAFSAWSVTPAQYRANCLNRMADLLEKNRPQLLSLIIHEAGKTLSNAVGEIREAIDFCRYYAAESIRLMSTPTLLPGPTGEKNQLSLHGRGTFVCISPWNFPLAIFLGQITAALAAGNTVLAKPAEQTPLLGYFAIQLLHEAGVPKEVIQFIPGPGETIGAQLTQSPLISGVIFTGSNDTARKISQTLAKNPGPILPLIAETGGQNCMIVDSTALPEQVVRDVLSSAFDSAGQRCSALRVLFIQEEVAETILTMLQGAMAELSIGNPDLLSTDIGPVIDAQAKAQLENHVAHMKQEAKLIFELPIPSEFKGTFVSPTVFEIKHINQLKHEVFGPILHIIRYKESELNQVIDQINSTGFGLTFGIHSRINEKVKEVTQKIRAGNLYINRNTIGAIVGTQPFGGEGLSGTGFKAGGPHYLLRLTTERCISEDTTASGGNTSLMSLQEE